MYDVIIIGSGIGGLICGNFLVRKKEMVLILEQHFKPGGYVCGFFRGKYYFDGGTQSFTSSGMLFPLLKKLNLFDKFEFERVYFRFKYPFCDITLNNYNNFKDYLIRAFPEERGDLLSFYTILDNVYHIMEKMSDLKNPYMESGISKIFTMIKYMLAIGKDFKKFGKSSNIKTKEVCKNYFKEGSDAYNFITNLGYPGMSIMNFGGMIYSFINDYWYPKCGLQEFSNILAKSFKEHGGEIRYKTKVNKIITKKRKVYGVETDGGNFNSKWVVSNADYKKTINNLLSRNVVPLKWLQEVNNAIVCEPVFAIFLAVNMGKDEIQRIMKEHHVGFSTNNKPIDYEDVSNPNFFNDIGITITCPTLINKVFSPKGKCSLIIQAFCPIGWMNNWGMNENNKEEYKRLKSVVTEKLLDTAEKCIPNLRDKIEIIDSATPYTHERYTGNTYGATAGWSWDKDKSYIKEMKLLNKTPIRYLLMASAWTFSPGGVPSSALSGKVASDLIK